jgi:uncharacterized protein (DUF885 family)
MMFSMIDHINTRHLLFFCMPALVTSCVLRQGHHDIAPGLASKALHAMFNTEWEYNLEVHPEWATYQGDDRYNDRLTDMSLESIARRQARDRDVLARLQLIPREALTESDQLNYDLFLKKYEWAVQAHAFKTHYMPIDQLDGPQLDFPRLVSDTQFRTTKDYRNYLMRLWGFPTYVDQVIILMQRGLAEGWAVPGVVLEKVPEQFEKQINMGLDENPFYRPFLEFPDGVPEAEREELAVAGRKAIESKLKPAYERLHEFLMQEYLPETRVDVGAWSLPDGEKFYRHLVRLYTTTDLGPEEIHEIGLKEVRRIRSEMERIARDEGFDGGISAYSNFLKNSPDFYYTSEDDLLTGYRDICKRIEPELTKLFGKFPRMPYGVKKIADYAAPARPTAYYMRPAADGSRAGYFYANTYNLQSRPKYEMEALTLHEAVPGHHFQIALAMELDDLPKFRRYGGYTAYVEGWGLYAESLGEDLGLYRDPPSKFGQLTYEMWRACRLVVDTGMHYFKWSRREAIDYMIENTGRDEPRVVVEVDRYIVWPGQALAYKIGELRIKEMRTLARSELGEDFNIVGFHDMVLGLGAIPLDILEVKVREYIGTVERD